MSALFRIVRAAHAKGTHHKLALDALARLQGSDSERWQNLFLKHADVFMLGSKAPDDGFKDFQNHVLHPRDGYWGGAPEQAEVWYTSVVGALKESKWEEAVYNAGVLSHYVSDPVMPFHTAQSAAENNIHRAVEWSINRSYDALQAAALASDPVPAVALAEGPHWLHDLVCAGADRSNAYYETLIAHYDFKSGVVDPPSGLDAISRRFVGELLVYARECLARVFDRAFAESGVTPPDVGLTIPTILAAVKIPAKMLQKRLADAADRKLVEAMYDELKATGRVEQNLPLDERTVKAAYAEQVLAPREGERASARAAKIKKSAERGPAAAVSKPGSAPAPSPKPAASAPASPRIEAPPLKAPPPPSPSTSAQTSVPLIPRTYLRRSDEVEAAPSIGPKMAQRLTATGVKTVADLISADAARIATRLADSRITIETVRDWQDQARLVIMVPGLRGTQAQLLTGSGCRTAKALAAANAEKLQSDIAAYARSPEGQRLLRDGKPPDLATVRSWISSASLAKAA